MKKKTILVLVALMAVFALMLTGCGKEEEAAAPTTVETLPTEATPLGLASWELSTSTWSSPNGATVHLTAIPTVHTKDQYAVFSVRLEGDDVENIPCEWNGTSYTASAELNAADGYCYYVVLTTTAGEQVEVAINTPAATTNEALINMETALNTYCHLLVESSDADDKKLTITAGTVQIQLPQITNDGESITCDKAALVLNFNGQETDRKELTLSDPAASGLYELSIADTRFDIPAMEDDQQLTLCLEVTLSNGQTLTDANGTWSYMDGQLISIVG